jgi:cytoskeleton protein RodZ
VTDSDVTRAADDGAPRAGSDTVPHPATGLAADSSAGLAAAGAATAGAMLAAARARAGLSIDAVAQQLKLGVRQVQALEDDNFAALPGRTFVRGFVRNYARLLKLDGDAVLAALPGSSAPALEAPSLHETAPSIGELPTTGGNRPGWTRWAIPLTLLAIIAGAAAYEFLRPTGDARHAGTKDTAAVATHAEPAKPAAESGVVALPNPIPPSGGPTGDAGNGAPPHPPSTAAPAAGPDTAARVGAPGAAAPSSPAVAPAPSAIRAVPAPATTTTTAMSAPMSALTTPTTAATVGDVTLVLAYKDSSWTEIRDRTGRVLLSRMNEGGQTQTVAGQPPFELTIGNATDVTLRYNGKPVDLAPHTRQNVARFTLP